MGNAAAVQNVAESSRRRLMLQQYNRQPKNVLISHSLVQAFEHRRLQSLQPHVRRGKRSPAEIHQAVSSKEPLKSLPLHEIYDVLTCDFGVQLSLEELPVVLRHFGCRLVESPTAASSSGSGEDWYSVQELVRYVAPRRILRQVKRPLECPRSVEFSYNGVTIWQAAKMGDLTAIEAVCDVHFDAYRALDDFDNSPLYYASLCGREVVVDFVLRAYEREGRQAPPDELLRCVTNALNQQIRGLLQQKITLEEVLLAKEEDSDSGENGDDNDAAGGTWFGLITGDDEE
ncbi:Histone H2A [Phytophthora cinnamomi]|uniref:Histone H2A n=1 Tax=Phytophthora cinnamomi TaxID=4785 RepID=UPI00355A3B0E|nr:Histone H2A [Phytophthora cinnamomi]